MIRYRLPFESYRQVKAANSSAIHALAMGISPAKYRSSPDVVTAAKLRGTLLHAMILEPESADERYLEEPKVSMATNSGKRELCQWLSDVTHTDMDVVYEESGIHPDSVGSRKGVAEGVALNAWLDVLRRRMQESGVVAVPEADMRACKAMQAALHERPDVSRLLDSITDTEISVFGDLAGLPTKIRPDALVSGGPIMDLKKVRDVSPRGFRRHMHEYGLLTQAAYYLERMHAETGHTWEWVWLAVEDTPPHDCCIYQPSPRDIEEGERMVEAGLHVYRMCHVHDVWPGQGWDWNKMSYAPRHAI